MKTRIAPAAAPHGPSVAVRIGSLAAGPCFGQPVRNAYLSPKGPWGWERALPKPGATLPAAAGIPQAPSCT